MREIGLIGVGFIGKMFLDRLHKDEYSVTVFDINEEKTTYAENQGARIASTPAGVAGATDVILIAVPGTPEVDAIMKEEDGILAELSTGQIVIDATTTLPETSIECKRHCENQGAMFIEAPITGAAPHEGFHMMIGGDRKDYEETSGILDSICDDHIYIGEVGKATIFKYGLQMRYAGQWALDAEIIEFVRDHNVDPAPFNEFLGMDMQEKYFTEDFAQDIEGLGGLAIWRKDIGYAQQTAHENNTALPINSAIHTAYKATARQARADEGHATSLIKYWQKLNND